MRNTRSDEDPDHRHDREHGAQILAREPAEAPGVGSSTSDGSFGVGPDEDDDEKGDPPMNPTMGFCARNGISRI